MKRAPGSYAGLTSKQAELLSYLRHRQEAGETPTFEEMRDAVDLASKSGVHRLLSGLEERGYVTRLFGRTRAITVHSVALPVEERQPVPTRAALGNFSIPALLDELSRRGLRIALSDGARA